jgi:hypothetical protein
VNIFTQLKQSAGTRTEPLEFPGKSKESTPIFSG